MKIERKPQRKIQTQNPARKRGVNPALLGRDSRSARGLAALLRPPASGARRSGRQTARRASNPSTIPHRIAPRKSWLPAATEEAAARAGLRHHYIRCALRGEFVPSLKRLAAMAAALRVPGPFPVHQLAFDLGLTPLRPPRTSRRLSVRELEQSTHQVAARASLGYDLAWAILHRRQPPTPLTAGKLAEAFGVAIDTLIAALGLKGETKP